ncbi:MAG TPA: 16S rRNA (adenine(1518)-N(6)/adenine(1519)-N(6))-dimethyltransferase RsmA [Gammaproteobacteria bacterium]|nr:16S rRNA (adenine(1518)-N(6)/adenine(1519)-N(6))-dimethyltransferase RsmA [Gammaproteobacteria bacterium]
MTEAPHRPRRRFGQHFLHETSVIDRIVRAAAIKPGDAVVEIGPGLGALTGALLEAAGRLDVVELDRDLAAKLRARFDPEAIHVHQADALEFDFEGLSRERGPLRVVGNLPYNISTAILFHLTDAGSAIRDMHLMLQKEVVDRMAASPGGRNYGRLSVMLQFRCQVEALFSVAPGAFRPPPKVHSTVVRLIPLETPEVPVSNLRDLERVVSLAFGMRRKTLRNSLKPVLTAAEIEAAGVDPGARPETLDLAAFAALANRLR